MPLRIKELYRTDLDPNSIDWWSSDKIDKLNYNFNLLSNGGMAGPAGVIGDDGNMGLDGAQGPQGYSGAQGEQGAQGPQGLSPWTEGRNNDYLTLFPNFQGSFEYQPLRVGLGQLDSEQNAISFQGPLHVLHNHNPIVSNLILNSENSNLGFHFRLSSQSSAKKLEIGKLDSVQDNLILQYDLETMDYLMHNTVNDNNYLLEATDSNLILRSTLIKLGTSSNTTTANSSFKYNNDAITDRVLVSLDSDGNSIWKNKADVFGSLPIGSIISITQDQFNETNFELAYSTTQQGTPELKIIQGRGKEDTSFEGWYLCNGKTWTDGVIQYEVPNLNSFNYSIDSNGGSQNEVVDGGDNSRILIAGYNLRMESTYASGEYSSTLVTPLQFSNNQITLTPTSGSFDVSRNIHIVYLKGINYYWTTEETTTTPTTNIVLSTPNFSAASACAANENTYKWTGGSTDWVTGNMSGITLYNSDLSAASIGWYEREGLARYWNGTLFSLSEPCEITYNINLATNSNVTQLNGTLSSGGSYTIDSPNFEDATLLLSAGSNAPEGWYRETNNQYGWRRYWNGNEFLGESFELPYIFNTSVTASLTNTSSACQLSQIIPAYYITGTSSPSGITDLHKINSSGGRVLVHLNWDGISQTGDKPLVSIYTQNAPSSGSPYKSLVDNVFGNTYRATIKNTSGLNTPIECANYTINGGTNVSPSIPETSGTINVISAPVTLTLSAFGGAGSISQCFTNATLTIFGVGTFILNANAYENPNTPVQIPSTGTYNYELSAVFGCSSGNSASIS